MKAGRVFWGTFLLVLGVLILLHNFVDLWLPWDVIWKFWPFALILIGLSALTKGREYRWLFNAGTALVAGFVLFASVQNGCSRVRNVFENGKYFTDRMNVSYDSTIKEANLVIEGGGGSYRIEDTTEYLVEARTKTSFGNYFFNEMRDSGKAFVELKLRENKIKFQGGNIKNAVRLAMNTAPIWSLDVNVGAAAVDLDLTPYKTKEINVDAGAASIEMRLGNLVDRTNVSIEAGASSIVIYYPEGSGCEILSNAELSSKDFIGFTKIDDRTYRTGNFTSSTSKIYIEIDAGISNIEVRPYSGKEPLLAPAASGARRKGLQPGVPMPPQPPKPDAESEDMF